MDEPSQFQYRYRRGVPNDRCGNARALDRLDHTAEFPAIAVEEHQFIAAPSAQNLGQMRAGALRQIDRAPGIQYTVDIHASQSHAGRSRLKVAFICAQLSHMLTPA